MGRSKIVQGKAKHYFLLIYNARTIYPEYHKQLSCYKLMQQSLQPLAWVTNYRRISIINDIIIIQKHV